MGGGTGRLRDAAQPRSFDEGDDNSLDSAAACGFAAATRDAEVAIKAELDTAEDKIDRLTREVRSLRTAVESLQKQQE